MLLLPSEYILVFVDLILFFLCRNLGALRAIFAITAGNTDSTTTITTPLNAAFTRVSPAQIAGWHVRFAVLHTVVLLASLTTVVTTVLSCRHNGCIMWCFYNHAAGTNVGTDTSEPGQGPAVGGTLQYWAVTFHLPSRLSIQKLLLRKWTDSITSRDSTAAYYREEHVTSRKGKPDVSLNISRDFRNRR